MVKYNGKEYSSIYEICKALNITEGQFKREYEKCENSKTAIQRCLVINNKVVTEVSDEDDKVEYDLVKGSLRELAKSLKIDYKTLVKNLDTMDIKNAIKAGKEARAQQSKKDNTRSMTQVERAHKDNVNRIDLILKRIDSDTDEIQYLLRINNNYRNAYDTSVELYQTLLLIYHAKAKGENTRYLRLKEKIAKGTQKELGYVIRDINYKLARLGVTKPDEIIKEAKEILTNYTNSMRKAVKVNDILSELYEEHLRLEQEKRRLEQENIIAEQHKREVEAIVNKLNVPFKIKTDMLDKKQFNNIAEVCSVINNCGLTIEKILRYTLNNQLTGSVESLAEGHLKNNKESLGHQIGRIMVKSGIIRQYKHYSMSGINGLAKMALEMTEEIESSK